jgi:hypothetical protein
MPALPDELNDFFATPLGIFLVRNVLWIEIDSLCFITRLDG